MGVGAEATMSQWDDESEPTMMRTVEAESVLLWTNEYPDEGYISTNRGKIEKHRFTKI